MLSNVLFLILFSITIFSQNDFQSLESAIKNSDFITFDDIYSRNPAVTPLQLKELKDLAHKKKRESIVLGGLGFFAAGTFGISLWSQLPDPKSDTHYKTIEKENVSEIGRSVPAIIATAGCINWIIWTYKQYNKYCNSQLIVKKFDIQQELP